MQNPIKIKDKSSFWKMLYKSILIVIVLGVLVRQAIIGRYENVFLCVLTLITFTFPMIFDRKLGVNIPTGLEIVMITCVFAAEIQGEIASFYTKFPFWDTMLHTINGAVMAAFGCALVDFFNRSEKFAFKLSPLFMAVVAFCFSMTIGVLWEFIEFTFDYFAQTDMQKDYIVHEINSVLFDPNGLNDEGHVVIDSLIVNGEDWIAKYGGYIDIGIIDTMKDLLVNFVGAFIFSTISFFYFKSQGKGKFAKTFIPVVQGEDELNARKQLKEAKRLEKEERKIEIREAKEMRRREKNLEKTRTKAEKRQKQ